MNFEHLRQLHAAAQRELEAVNSEIQRARADTPKRERDRLDERLKDAADEVDRTADNLADAERREAGRNASPSMIRALNSARGVSTSEPRTYSEHSERSFFTDALAFKENADPSARERLERHGLENGEELRNRGIQLRDVGTGAFAGFTIPQYLVDLYAPLARAASPTLNLIANKQLLPEKGMTLNLGRITTGSATAAQASENSAVQETDLDDTLLTVNVRTYAGQQDVSRQSLERSEMVDTVVFQDLVADYFTKVNDAILNAAGTSGTHLGIRSTAGIIAVSYTDGTPTVPELYPKLADAIRQVNAGLYTQARATTIIMHSRRWGWGTAALDSSNRPLFLSDSNGPFNALAVGEAAGYGQVMGKIQALPVVTDDALPTTNGAGTNEDIILVVAGANLVFWSESPDLMPRQFRFEQANAPQSIRLAVWGYSAFSAGKYPGGSAVISGTGLTAPTF